MQNKVCSNTSKNIRSYQTISIIAYFLVIVIASSVLIIEPNNFDAKMLIAPFIMLLALSSIGIGHKIAFKSESKTLSVLSTGALAILFTFLGFFILCGVGYLIGLSHASQY